MLSEGRFSPFPFIPEGQTVEGFSFKREFGRKEGKKISRDLFRMLNEHPEVHELDLDFVIPLSIAIFGKHKYSKANEDRVKSRLTRTIEVDPKVAPEFKYNTIRPNALSLYESAFGKYPISEHARKEALSDTKDYFINDFYDGYTITGAIYAQRHLSLGGTSFWTKEATERMLEELKVAILEEWQKYQTNSVLRPSFATFVHAYKILKEAI